MSSLYAMRRANGDWFALGAAEVAEEESFMRKGSVLFLVPLLGTLLVLAVVLMRA